MKFAITKKKFYLVEKLRLILSMDFNHLGFCVSYKLKKIK